MIYQHWLAFLLSMRGEIVTPRPRPHAPGDTWSRRVTSLQDLEWQRAGEAMAAGKLDTAADWAIAASGNGIARIFEEGVK